MEKSKHDITMPPCTHSSSGSSTTSFSSALVSTSAIETGTGSEEMASFSSLAFVSPMEEDTGAALIGAEGRIAGSGMTWGAGFSGTGAWAGFGTTFCSA